ncbi:MAG: PAS domain-containing hybrid sensor histidine kinase/response regulator [Wenzhouxiangellaceae bacterium]|nr:PAS domain-containing hybrid sensor histidine kinase/response regulator [Wenzhouxiangellaceae bacterium]
MFTPPLIAALALTYVGLLFAIAWYGDRIPDHRLGRRSRAVIYSLSLAVYCTSWTFFGAVGSAVTNGWLFATIYLGPILVMLLGHDLMLRILKLSRDRRLTSISDFIAYRFGRSRRLAVLITLAAVFGAIPYIALQLKAVTVGVVIMSDRPSGLSEASLALVLALALSLFAILFGARRLEASEHHRGMVIAIAFESLVKMVAFAAVGLWAMFSLLGGPAGLAETITSNDAYRDLFRPSSLPGGFWVQTLLGGAAILCLPRQFQMAFVENERIEDLNTARWLFPVYLVLFTLLVVPIAVAGMERFAGTAINADTFVLSLPISAGQPGLTMLSFLGGFSAATGMVIVATVALATMVSNDLIVPLLMRLGLQRGPDFGRVLLLSRQLAIIVLALAAWFYYLVLSSADALASIGLMSFAAVVQFAPALVLGVYWREACREGAITGLVLGLAGWLLMIFLPSIWPAWPSWLQPGLETATLINLSANVVALVAVSLWVRQRRPTLPTLLGQRAAGRPLTIGELRRLAMSFIGRDRVDLAFAHALDSGSVPDLVAVEQVPANAELVGFTERLLSGCIGSASARAVLTAGLQRSGMNAGDALSLLEEASSAIQFNRDLLEATLDHISQGVSVVDADLRLISWNEAYVKLLDYPPKMVYPGRAVDDLIRFNLGRRPGVDPDVVEAGVNRRMHHMRRGTPYVFERHDDDGRVIEIRGNPMPHGGYVTTYTDITGFKRTERELKSAYETMEQQVTERTRELHDAMDALSLAKREAEHANQTKTRFLAAASHDLLQPLNAARLFSSNLSQRAEQMASDEARLVRRVDHSLGVAEELLSALLDISRMDQGALQPKWSEIPVRQLLAKVERQFSDLAERRGLRLRVRFFDAWVRTDVKLLQRILFNLVNNALRYTSSGGVLIGCRRRGQCLRIEVWDTGPGIAESERERIFEEFERLGEGPEEIDDFDQGLGLGLAICRRISHMLEAPLDLRSTPGRGSAFSIQVPVVSAHRDNAETVPLAAALSAGRGFDGLRVLCIDDDPEILEAMQLLLGRWGCEVSTASSRAQALALADTGLELIVADYHLQHGEDGLRLARAVQQAAGWMIPVLVVTADRSNALGRQLEKLGYRWLFKPVKPAALRALMRHAVSQRRE